MKALVFQERKSIPHRSTLIITQQKRRPLQFSPGLGQKWTIRRNVSEQASTLCHSGELQQKNKKAISIISTRTVAVALLFFVCVYVYSSIRRGGMYPSLLFIYLHSYSAQGTQCAFAAQLFIYIRRRLPPPPRQINLMFRGEAPPQLPAGPTVPTCRVHLGWANQGVTLLLLVQKLYFFFLQSPLRRCSVLKLDANY